MFDGMIDRSSVSIVVAIIERWPINTINTRQEPTSLHQTPYSQLHSSEKRQ